MSGSGSPGQVITLALVRLGRWILVAGRTARGILATARRLAGLGARRIRAAGVAAGRSVVRAMRAAAAMVRATATRLILAARVLGGLAISWGRIAAVVALVSLVLAGGAFAASRLSSQFGSGQSVVDARGWAARPQVYSTSSCQACHPGQATAKVAGLHANVSCETCHGPQGDHPGTNPNVLARLATPTSDLCITCHAQVPGKPIGFPSVVLALHYSGGVCLRCHDPHTIAAVRPPDVTHPLADLPACTTCHAPDGLKKVPAGHELVADTICLSCHATNEAAR